MIKSLLKRLVSCFISGAMMLSMSSTVLPMSISAESQNYPYTFFAADGKPESISAMGASNFTVNGSICTNGTFITSASNPNINGQRIENADEDMIYIFNKIAATYFSMANLETHDDDYGYESTNINLNNPLMVAGELELTGNINLNASVMALEDVVLNGEVKNSNNAIISSKYGDVIIDNYSSVSLNNGLIYAPFGNVEINSQNVNINGIIIAKSITFNASNVNVNYNSNVGSSVGTESEELNIPFREWSYLEDTDGDTLPNIIEKQKIGSDPTNSDTDGDGLPDGYEFLVFLTDPLLRDTDGNGIEDGDEDFDEDGLNNLGEYISNANPWNPDTDGDGLTDGDEVNIYGSNPLKVDTDDDGLLDALELKYAMIPTNPDTLNDGILDGDRTFEISLNSELSDNGLVQAHLSIELTGKQVESLSIDKVSEDDLFLNPEMPGYMGNAFNFNVDGEFSRATLTYEFDESFFNDPEFVPSIYYWNEENQFLEELPNQIINGNTVKVELEHFSTYTVIAKNSRDEFIDSYSIKAPTDEEYRNRTFDVALVLDESGSISSANYSLMKTMCSNLLENFIDEDRISIFTFDHTSRKHLGFSDKNTAISTLSTLPKNSGGTAICNAIYEANNEFMINSSSDVTKIMIVLTDGNGNGSYTPASVAQTAANNDIIIYTVGVGSVNSTDLITIAETTGGAYYNTSNFSQLEGIFDRIILDTDLRRDSDNDEISDYHEKKISAGELTSGSGAPIRNFTSLNYLNIDSDNDELLDGEELLINVQYVNNKEFCYATLYSNPCMLDSDGDDLGDGEESYIGTEPLMLDTDKDKLSDGLEVELWFDPLNTNYDNDSYNDYDEWINDTSPFVYNMTASEAATAFAEGVAFGDWVTADTIEHLLGQIAGAFIPFVDARDYFANVFINLDTGAALLNVGGFLLDFIPAAGVGADVAKALPRLGKFVVKFSDDVPKVVEGIARAAKHFPNPEDVIPKLVKWLPAGFVDDFAKSIAKNGDKITKAEYDEAFEILESCGKNIDNIPLCFISGTLISTEKGFSSIEDIQVNDDVWSFDENTSQVSLKKVVNVFENETSELIHVTVNGETISTTLNHPFYVPVKGWVNAANLRAGDALFTINGEYVVVEVVQHEILESPVKVYNFEVADNHAYFVGSTGVGVHNRCVGNKALTSLLNKYNLSYVTNPVKNYDIRLFNNLLGSKSGFKAHEILQFSWLKKNGYTALRGVGVGGANPVIALTEAQHIKVNRLQRLAGLTGNTIKNMSPYEVMNKNLDILIEIGVPVDKVDELRPLVIEFIDNLDNLKGAL